jgi:peptide/nickel transport system substrate-binding protein
MTQTLLEISMSLRTWLGVTALALPLLAPPAQAAGNLTAVLESEVVFLDPHGTTANITRTFAFMVYDTLFAMNQAGEIKPQMVDTYTVSDDKLTYTFTLRPGLKFQDGAPVTSEDVVASLKRWGPKDGLGRKMFAATASLEANDAKTFTLKLKEPFPLVIQTLGKPNSIVPFIVPARLAGEEKITEITGSGPFIFRKEMWRTGDVMVLDRNPAYVPRKEKPDFLAGGKDVKLDRVTLRTIPDVSTAASALLAGEIDYLQYVPWDWIERLKSDKNIRMMSLGGLDQFQANFRLNHASPPFDNPAIRRVLWKLVDQNAMQEAVGIPPEFHLKDCKSFWMCGTPLESNAGTEVARFDIEAAKAELKAAGYKGEKVVVMEMPNSATTFNATLVLVEAMRKAGFNVDEQSMDWGTLLQRRVKKDTWGLFGVYSNGVDMSNPLTHFYVAANCANFPGWSCDEAAKPLMDAFVKADTDAKRKAVADQIQAEMYKNTPSVMWGQFTVPTAYRSSLTNIVESSYPMFWQVEKK